MARCSSPGPGCSVRPRIATPRSPSCARRSRSGVNHIDTSDFYGPHVTNQLIREALHPYPDDLVIVTKVGAVRGEDASWNPAIAPADLARAVHDNLRNLGVDVLDVVNLRIMGRVHEPSEGSIEEPFTALAELQRQGLIRHLGLSNVTSAQVAAGARHRRGRLRAEPLQPRPSGRRRPDRRARGHGHRLRALLPPRRLHAAAVLDPLGCGGRARRDADAGGARLAASPRAQHSADPGHLLARSPAREPQGGRASSCRTKCSPGWMVSAKRMFSERRRPAQSCANAASRSGLAAAKPF